LGGEVDAEGQLEVTVVLSSEGIKSHWKGRQDSPERGYVPQEKVISTLQLLCFIAGPHGCIWKTMAISLFSGCHWFAASRNRNRLAMPFFECIFDASKGLAVNIWWCSHQSGFHLDGHLAVSTSRISRLDAVSRSMGCSSAPKLKLVWQLIWQPKEGALVPVTF